MTERDLSQPITHTTTRVHRRSAGVRLDLFLAKRFRWGSRQYFVERIETGEVSVNGLAADKVNLRLVEGDEVSVLLSEEVRRVSWPELVVLYEDEWLLILNKQAGAVVHPAGRHLNDTIMNALHGRYRVPDDPARDVVPRLAHRLDRETSGLLLVSKKEDVLADLMAQFRDHGSIEKQYLVVVRGRVPEDSGLIDRPIGPDDKDPINIRRRVRDDGAPSRTAYRVLERFEHFTYLEVGLLTGRQHQIRVHFQDLGTPVVCDEFYTGVTECRVGDTTLHRLALHHARLGFRHPGTGERAVFEAPLHQDMVEFLDALRRDAQTAS